MVIPRATYRVQLHRDFTFRDAREIVPYLAALGISHLYTSPFLKARIGSQHGYDVVDHGAVNPEIGTEDELDALVASLQDHGMGLMLDLVPNHMGVLKADNRWWLDALEHGEASRYAGYFDIHWDGHGDGVARKVVLPILGDHYGTVLERGELAVRFDPATGSFNIWYYEHRLPIRPNHYPYLLIPGLDRLESEYGALRDTVDALRQLAGEFSAVRTVAPAAGGPQQDAAEVSAALQARLATLCAAEPRIARFIESNVEAGNGVPGDPASFDALHALIAGQAYRLAYWRVASDDINYRRFFDINDLAALRAERQDVFDDTHRLVLRLLAQRKADCLRIDHPDGLLDPCEYFVRLQDAARAALDDGAADAQGRAIYLVIEKILADHERLPPQWPVHGTTGYRFMNVVNGLFVDTAARARFDRLYAAFVGDQMDFDEVLRRSRTLIIVNNLAGEMNQLATALARIARRDRHTCDFTRTSIHRALVAIVAAFPVYRTYVTAAGASDDDRRHIDWAVAVAKRQDASAETSVFDFVGATLRGERTGADTEATDAVLRFVQRFQQYLAPVKAKGMEDTAFYIYTRLASLNEVGGDPRTFGFTVQAFHGASQDRALRSPHTMLATSTHDNKRAEDVRTRIDVLSEMPAVWRLALRRWSQFNRRLRTPVDGEPAPSRNDEYLLYQTLIGAWPLEPMDEALLQALRERIQAYMVKAAREAKVHTSWVNPQPAYESALERFIDGALSGLDRNPFLQDFIASQASIAVNGCVNSLAQTLVKLTSPGVPDTYQGTELWDFSLVDPDNRRPVDYALRTRQLSEVSGIASAGGVGELLAGWKDGRIKLWLTARLLALRRERAAWFQDAGYLPIAVAGEHARHVCAYARTGQSRMLVTVVARLWLGLMESGRTWPLGAATWGDTALTVPKDAGTWLNLLTGETGPMQVQGEAAGLPLADILTTLPIALLEFTMDRSGEVTVERVGKT